MGILEMGILEMGILEMWHLFWRSDERYGISDRDAVSL